MASYLYRSILMDPIYLLNFLTVFFLLLLPTAGQASQALTQGEHLRKISLHTRGLHPLLYEYNELASSTDKGAYLKNATEKYLKSRQGGEKLAEKFFNLIKVKSPPFGSFENLDFNFCEQPNIILDFMVSETLMTLLRQGYSFPEILVSPYFHYAEQLALEVGRKLCEGEFKIEGLEWVPLEGFYDSQIDFSKIYTVKYLRVVTKNLYQFFQTINTPTNIKSLKKFLDVKYLTLPSTVFFNNRYNSTEFSVAAAFSEIYFCNSINDVDVDALESSMDENTKPIWSVAFSKVLNALKKLSSVHLQKDISAIETGEVVEPEDHQEKHAKGSCYSCHRILDPNEKLLAAQWSGPFKLVFDDDFLGEQNVEVEQVSSLFETVKSQDQFKRCQTQRYLDLFLGKDVTYTSEQINDYQKTLFESGGRHLPLIQKLITSKEFYSDDSFSQPTNILAIKPILKKCNSCHNFSLTQGSLATAALLYGSTNTFHFGENQYMPPAVFEWELSEADYLSIDRFVYWNGRSADNTPSFSDATKNRRFKLDKYSKDRLNQIRYRTWSAKFGNYWKRITHGYDFVKTLYQVYPDAHFLCEFIYNEELQGISGALNPSTGEHYMLKPNLFYENVQGDCIYKAAMDEMKTIRGLPTRSAANDDIKKLRYYNKLAKYNLSGLDFDPELTFEDVFNMDWFNLSKKQKYRLIQNSIEGLLLKPRESVVIGRVLKIKQDLDFLLNDPEEESSLKNAFFWIQFFIITDDMFRNY